MPGTSRLPALHQGSPPCPPNDYAGRQTQACLPDRKSARLCGPAPDAPGSSRPVAGSPSTQARPTFKMHLSAASNPFREQAGCPRRRPQQAHTAFPAPRGSGPAQTPDAALTRTAPHATPGCSSSTACASCRSSEGREHPSCPVLPCRARPETDPRVRHRGAGCGGATKSPQPKGGKTTRGQEAVG